jgi:hypothetical protein
MEDQMNSDFLRRVLIADAIVSGVAGVVMIAGAGVLAPLLSLPQALLAIAGAALIPWVLGLIALARMTSIPRFGVRAAITVNALWVAGSILALFVTSPSLFGYVFIIAQAATVAAFAELQTIALKRRPAQA